MQRFKKIRGHKKIWKDIENWVSYNKNLDINYLKKRKRDYVKVWVSPYKNISITNSEFTPPKGKTRQKIINGIFEIYQNWELELEKLGIPYYLKIWHFPHNASKNQVVCAIEDFINFYDYTFFKPESNKTMPDKTLGLTWEYHQQEHHITIDDIGNVEDFYTEDDYVSNKKWIEK